MKQTANKYTIGINVGCISLMFVSVWRISVDSSRKRNRKRLIIVQMSWHNSSIRDTLAKEFMYTQTAHKVPCCCIFFEKFHICSISPLLWICVRVVARKREKYANMAKPIVISDCYSISILRLQFWAREHALAFSLLLFVWCRRCYFSIDLLII